MRLLIISFFLSVTLLCNAQTKKFVVVASTASAKIGIIGTGDSTLLIVPRVWIAMELKYSQTGGLSVGLDTYRTYNQLLLSQTLPTDLPTSSYTYQIPLNGNIQSDLILTDIRNYYIGMGYNSFVVTK